jgi:hypothetical protein
MKMQRAEHSEFSLAAESERGSCSHGLETQALTERRRRVMVPTFQDFLVADLVSSPPPCRWSRRSLSELGPGSCLSARLIAHRRPVETASREVTLFATCIARGEGAEGRVDGELNQTSNRARGGVIWRSHPKASPRLGPWRKGNSTAEQRRGKGVPCT